LDYQEAAKIFLALDPLLDELVNIGEDIDNRTFSLDTYAQTIIKLDQTGKKLKDSNNGPCKLIGIKIIGVVKEIKRYDNTARSKKRLVKALEKLDAAINNEALFKGVV
jgi:hypothetical protein